MRAEKRVVSLAPALTEIVFALGKGKALVGTTRFCDYPEEARGTPKIGGYLDMSLERLLATRPDVILGYQEHRGLLAPLPARTPRVCLFRHDNLADLYATVEGVAEALGLREEGRKLAARLRGELAEVARRTVPGPRLRVLLVAGHDPGSLDHLVRVGRRDFLSELLELVGAENAYAGQVPYPLVTHESVIAMRPDWIIDLVPERGPEAPWHELTLVPAVRRGRVRTLTGPLWVRPGPRVTQIARRFAAILAP